MEPTQVSDVMRWKTHHDQFHLPVGGWGCFGSQACAAVSYTCLSFTYPSNMDTCSSLSSQGAISGAPLQFTKAEARVAQSSAFPSH